MKINFNILLIIFFLLNFPASYSIGLDSLKLLEKTADEDFKPELYNRMSVEYLKIHDIKNAKSYSKLAIDLAVKTDNKNQLAFAYKNLASVYYTKKQNDSAIENFRSAYKIFDEIGNKFETANVFNNFGAVYSALNVYDKALYFYKKALDLREVIADKPGIAKSYNNIGLLYYRWGNYDDALIYYRKALHHWKQAGNKKEIASSYRNLGLLYYKWGKYNKALENHLSELKINEQLKQKSLIASTMNSIGKVYYDWGNYSKAIEYYKNALEIVKESGIKYKTAQSYSNIGTVYFDWRNFEKALEFYNRALKLTEDEILRIKNSENRSKLSKVRSGKATLLNNIGLVFLDKGNYPQALKFCKQSYDIKEELSYDDRLFYPLTSISSIYLKMNNFTEALNYANKSLELAQKFNKKGLIQDAYYLFYEIYSASGNSSKALEYHISYTRIRESIISEEMNQKFVEMEVKYESEKKAKENEQRAKENNRLKKMNVLQRTYFIVISGLILSLSFVLYNRYRQKQKAHNLLSEKNQKIIDQNDKLTQLFTELSEKEKKLRDANAAKDKFFSIIAHDLKNPLQTLMLSSDMLLRFGDKFDKEEIDHKHNTIYKTTKNLSDLLESLLQWARTQTGKIQFKPELIDLNILTLKNLNLLSASALKKNITISSDIGDSTYVEGDYNMLITVIRNLLTNAIKFTGLNGRISIKAEDFGDMVKYSVTDTGIGISEEDQKKLFRLDSQFTTPGTIEEKGTGLGLILCKEFIDHHGGSISVESQQGKGSVFSFTLSKKAE